jgi:hypothetical protein
MVTKLSTPLRRLIEIDKAPYVVTLSTDGLKLVEKGHRKGMELPWAALVNGDAELAAALSASVLELPRQAEKAAASKKPKKAVSDSTHRPRRKTAPPTR